MNKKGAELSVTATISIVLVVLVIAVVALFIFNPRIYDWIRNLPGYNYDDTDKVINPENLPEESSVAGVCPNGVLAKIKNSYFYFSENAKSDLYWDGGEDRAKIFLSIEKKFLGIDWARDKEVGEVEGRIVRISSEFSDKYPELNNSYNAGNNIICKRN